MCVYRGSQLSVFCVCVYDKHVGLSARLSVVELINEDLEMVLHAYLLYLVLSLSYTHARAHTLGG